MRYVTYQRDESGLLTRIHDAPHDDLTEAQRAKRYPHAESLLGWPERTVYWSRETGPAVGVATFAAPLIGYECKLCGREYDNDRAAYDCCGAGYYGSAK